MKHEKVSVSTTITQVMPVVGQHAQGNIGYPTAGILRNLDTGQTVYLGNSDVDTATGWPLAAGEDIEIDLIGDILWGVVAAGSCDLYVLRRA